MSKLNRLFNNNENSNNRSSKLSWIFDNNVDISERMKKRREEYEQKQKQQQEALERENIQKEQEQAQKASVLLKSRAPIFPNADGTKPTVQEAVRETKDKMSLDEMQSGARAMLEQTARDINSQKAAAYSSGSGFNTFDSELVKDVNNTKSGYLLNNYMSGVANYMNGLVNTPSALADMVTGGKHDWDNKDIRKNPTLNFDLMQKAMYEADKDGTPLPRFAGDLAQSAGQLVPQMLIGAGTGLGSELMAAGVFGNEYKQNRKDDMGVLASAANAGLKAGSEYVTEKLLGVLGEGAFKTVSKIAPKATSNPIWTKFANSYGGKIAEGFTGEFAEEAVQEPISLLIDKVTGKEVSEEDIKNLPQNMLYSGLLGGITGGLADGVVGLSHIGLNKRIEETGKEFNNADTVKHIVSKGLASDKKGEFYRTAEAVKKKLDTNQKVTDYEVGNLIFNADEQTREYLYNNINKRHIFIDETQQGLVQRFDNVINRLKSLSNKKSSTETQQATENVPTKRVRVNTDFYTGEGELVDARSQNGKIVYDVRTSNGKIITVPNNAVTPISNTQNQEVTTQKTASETHQTENAQNKSDNTQTSAASSENISENPIENAVKNDIINNIKPSVIGGQTQWNAPLDTSVRVPDAVNIQQPEDFENQNTESVSDVIRRYRLAESQEPETVQDVLNRYKNTQPTESTSQMHTTDTQRTLRTDLPRQSVTPTPQLMQRVTWRSGSDSGSGVVVGTEQKNGTEFVKVQDDNGNVKNINPMFVKAEENPPASKQSVTDSRIGRRASWNNGVTNGSGEIVDIEKRGSSDMYVIRTDDGKTTKVNGKYAEIEENTNTFRDVTDTQADTISNAENRTDTDNNKKISKSMSDEERFNILKNKSLDIVSFNEEKLSSVRDLSIDELKNSKIGAAKPILKTIAEQFDIIGKTYENADIELDFKYSNRSFNESVQKQHTNYDNFAKMLSVFDEVIANAVGIEAHNDRYKGTSREDAHNINNYVLVSAFADKDGIVPVRMLVKEFDDKANSLRMTVSLNKIEDSLHTQTPTNKSDGQKYAPLSSNISLSDFFAKVNPADGDFLKYVPDGFLNDEQKASKQEAIGREEKYIEQYKNSKDSVKSDDDSADKVRSQTNNNTSEKADLQVGDVIEYNGKRWKVTQTGFYMTFENLDKNDKEALFSFVGGMEYFKNTHDYTVVTNKTKENTVNQTKTGKGNEKSQKIADFVFNKLSNGAAFTSNELFSTAADIYGGTMANNVFTSKDAYDAMELGINQYILSRDNISFEDMFDILKLIPTQTKRADGMDSYQQFSTPPTIAYLAEYAANVTSDDVMFEPSAGIGGIAVFGKRDGAIVYVNELDKRRLEIIKNIPFDGYYNENAEQINNILGGKLEPTVVVMNPPFSSSADRNLKNGKIGAEHIEQALKLLAPGGRLVAITGRGMAEDAPAFRKWWKGIKEEYNVIANIGIDGANYTKYGTSFDIQLLVIDKNGATEQPVKTGYVKNISELKNMLEDIRNGRPILSKSDENNGIHSKQNTANTGNEQRADTNARSETDENKGQQTKGKQAVSDSGGGKDNKSNDTQSGNIRPSAKSDNAGGEGAVGRGLNVTDDVADSAAASDRGRVGNNELGTDAGNIQQEDSSTRKADGTKNSVNENNRGASDAVSKQSSDTNAKDGNIKRVKKKALTDSVYESYQTQKLTVKGAKPHPSKIVESAAMSSVNPPELTYKPSIPQDIIESGTLSDIQLEAISYAGQANNQKLPSSKTRGFFIGDGTGVGKGRTISGILLDNWNKGRKKAIWISKNNDLFKDSKEFITDVFGNSDMLIQFAGGDKAAKALSADKGILYATYPTIAKKYNDIDSNLNKIIEWCGKDFDGVIVFDEAHMMANAGGKETSRGSSKPSDTAIAGMLLQDALPNARIVYSSATGATEVENLKYAERLGLWGEGTSFTNSNDFVSKIKSGGIAVLEMVAQTMKQNGVYLARSLSFDGVVYDKIVHKLTAQQKDMYNTAAEAWQIVLQNINKALDLTKQGGTGGRRGDVMGAFWKSNQSFFNQLMVSMQTPSVIKDIEKQLEKGNSCVIQLVGTGEAQSKRELERIQKEGLTLDDYSTNPNEILISLVDNAFPINQFEEYVDSDGKKCVRPVLDSDGNPVENRDAVIMRDELVEKLSSIKLPGSPIDMIINHFGTDLVAENTGRNQRVIEVKGEKKIEKRTAADRTADVEAFQNGPKRIMIFSKAGGTGKSYHASRSVKNQQQRIHYMLEAGWQADSAVQGLGRDLRSNMVVPPVFKLVTTDLRGQMRFISTIAKRLAQLGSLTKGQSQTGSQGLFSSDDDLENPLACSVLSSFYIDLVNGLVDNVADGRAVLKKLGINIFDEYGNINNNSSDMHNMRKFLNRILCLTYNEQNAVFDGFDERLKTAVEIASQDGTLNKGMENYRADSLSINEEQVIHKNDYGAETVYTSLTAKNKTHAVKFEDVGTETNRFVGFFVNKNNGAVRAAYRTADKTDEYGNVTRNYRIEGQTSKQRTYISERILNQSWEKTDNAKNLWDDAVANLPEYTESEIHLISGDILSVWDKLPEENVRVYRMLTDDGNVILGRVIKSKDIDNILRRLGASRNQKQYSVNDVIQSVQTGGTVVLDNGYKIVQRVVSGEKRIEVLGMEYYGAARLKEQGNIFSERIGSHTRYFVPNGDKLSSALGELLKNHTVVEITDGSSETIHYSLSSNKNKAVQQMVDVQAPTSDVRNASADTASKSSASQDGENVKYSKGNNRNPQKTEKKSTEPSKPIQQIIKEVSDRLHLPVGTGKITNRNANGIFKEHANVIRLRIANDLPIFAHELGHYFDSKYNFSELSEIDEVISNSDNEFLEQYPESEHASEAFAEFMRVYLLNREAARRTFPKFSTEFENAIRNTEDFDTFDKAAHDMNQYMTQGVLEKMSAAMATENDAEKLYKLTTSETREKRRMEWVDAFAPIERAAKFVSNQLGQKLYGADDAYTLATNSLNAQTKTANILKVGLFDINGHEIGNSFFECLSGINAKDTDDFQKYLIARHAPYWLRQDMRVYADDDLNDIETMEKVRSEYEKNHPEFKEAAEKLYEFQRKVMQAYLVDTGIITQEYANSLWEKYPDYIPLRRVLGKNINKAKSTFANQNVPIRRAHGSGLAIISPLESIVSNTQKYVTAAMRNQTMQALAHYADTVDGFGEFMERVPPDMVRRITDISQEREGFAQNLDELFADESAEIMNAFDDVFGNEIVSYDVGRQRRDIVTVLRNGEKQYYQVHDRNFLEAIAELTPKDISNIDKFCGNIMNATKELQTSLNYVFGIRNPMRDIKTGYSNSIVTSPFEYAKLLGSAFMDVVTKSNDYRQFIAMGGGHSSELAANMDQIQYIMRKLAKKDRAGLLNYVKAVLGHPKQSLVFGAKDLYGAVTRFSDLTETVPRFAEFKAAKARGFDNQQAIYNADKVTTNFKRAGTKGRRLNKFYMYFNASVQGLDVFYDNIKSKPLQQILKYLIPSILSMLVMQLWNRHFDKEGWENLSQYTKNNYYCYSLGGNGKFFKIPKAREAAVFDSFAERVWDSIADGDMALWRDFAGYAAENLLPNIVPTAWITEDELPLFESIPHEVFGNMVIGPLVDSGFNRDFKGSPIVSKSMENAPKREQYTGRTSFIAVQLGKILNQSPLKIDHIIKSSTGILGTINSAWTAVEKSERKLIPGLSNSFTANANYSTDIINRAYTKKDKAVDKFTFNKTSENGMEAEKQQLITSYISGMTKVINSLPYEQQSTVRGQMLENVKNMQQSSGIAADAVTARFGDALPEDFILTKLPSSTLERTQNKVKQTYQLSPDEYNQMINEIITEVTKIRQNSLPRSGNAADDKVAKTVSEQISKRISDIKYKYKNKHNKDFIDK